MATPQSLNKSNWAKPLILFFVLLFIAGNAWVTVRTAREWNTAKNGNPIQLKVLNNRRVCRMKRKSVLIDYNGPYKIKLYGSRCRKAIYQEGQFANFRISKKGMVVAEENSYQPRLITAILLFAGGIAAFFLLTKKLR